MQRTARASWTSGGDRASSRTSLRDGASAGPEDAGQGPGGSPRGPVSQREGQRAEQGERGEGEDTTALEAGAGGAGAVLGGLEPGAWDTAVTGRRGGPKPPGPGRGIRLDGACFLPVRRVLPKGLPDTGACRALAPRLRGCCHGHPHAWGPGLPAILGLRGLAVVRDDRRPRGPALPEPSRLAHFGTVTAA